LAQLTPDEVLKLHVSEGVHQGTFCSLFSSRMLCASYARHHHELVLMFVRSCLSSSLPTGRYFKDGPPPEVTSIYVKEDKAEKRDIPIETKPDLAFSVPQCLQRLFEGEKILPYHLPSWLQPFAQIKKVPGTVNDVDLDIDVYGLFEELHRQAYKLLGQESKPEHVEKYPTTLLCFRINVLTFAPPLRFRAKDFLESMLTIVPDHPLALYNLVRLEQQPQTHSHEPISLSSLSLRFAGLR
jgi:hypothetical protein